jgi:hypothetical protein
MFSIGCKKIETDSSGENQTSRQQAVQTAGRQLNTIGSNLNKIPVFNSLEEFVSVANSLSSLSADQFAQFELNNNFKSMRTCFEEIVNAEEIIANNLENSGSIKVSLYNNTHSELLNTYNGCYAVKTMPDGGLFLEINAPSTKYA